MDPADRSADELAQTIRMLEEEIAILRRRLQDAPRRVRVLEERLLEAKGRLSQAVSQNERLSAVLEETRGQLALLRTEVEKLTAPPNSFGIIDAVNADGTLDVLIGGRKLRVSVQPAIEVKELERGQEQQENDRSHKGHFHGGGAAAPFADRDHRRSPHSVSTVPNVKAIRR